MKVLLACIVMMVSIWQLTSHSNAQDVGRGVSAEAIQLANGYMIEPVVTNLSLPTTLIFDGSDMLIAESGYLQIAAARILRIKRSGEVQVVVERGLEPPVTGLLLIDETLYVSHKGKVSVVDQGGLKDVVTDLPSNGDHHNNTLVFGPDRKIYLGQGTTTNSGVVGNDNYLYGWLEKNPQAHEIPCKDIVLSGQNFESDNAVPSEKRPSGFPYQESVTTGSYKPYGVPSTRGEIIKGDVKCGGSILRFNPDGSQLEVYAWGLRNPYGLVFDTSGQLWATNHGADVRGSRPIFNDDDYLIQVTPDAWYGWPDYFNGLPATHSRFTEPLKPSPSLLWSSHPPISRPFMSFPTHAGVNGIAISTHKNFGYEGNLFIAEFGTYTIPTGGINIALHGFRISRIDPTTKSLETFAANKLPGPSYLNRTEGFNRPTDVKFSKDGSLYIVDWGASQFDTGGITYTPQTGVIWRVYSSAMQPVHTDGPIVVPAAVKPANERDYQFKFASEVFTYYGPEFIALLLPLVIFVLLVGVAVYRKFYYRRTD